MLRKFLHSNGSILIVTLWVLLFLSVLIVSSGSVLRQEILLFKKLGAREALYDAAYSGAMRAVDFMEGYKKIDIDPKVDSFKDSWACNDDVFYDQSFENCFYNVSYTYFDNLTGKKSEVYGLTDEESKLNLNGVQYNVLTQFFTVIVGLKEDLAEEIATNIVDWRDAGDKRYGSKASFSERIYYNNEEMGYNPKNAPFGTLEELLLVKGMTPEIYTAIRDYITVFGNGRININTASREVLISLGLSDLLTYKIVKYRAGIDAVELTEDDNIFIDINSAAGDIAAFIALTKPEKDMLNHLIAKKVLDVKSTCFRAESTGFYKKDGQKVKVLCIFDREGSIKYWGVQHNT